MYTVGNEGPFHMSLIAGLAWLVGQNLPCVHRGNFSSVAIHMGNRFFY